LTNRATGASPASIDQLSHDVVAEWIESEKISLRPAQQLSLKNAIANSVPAFLETHEDLAMDQFAQTVKEEERKACLDIVAAMEEPFPGFVSKQRLMNIYAYPDAQQQAQTE